MKRRATRVACAGILVCAAGLVWALVPDPAAHAASSLIGWTSTADANPVDIVVDSIPGLSGEHPLSEADLPEDSSTFETGPYGTALASVFWPGATAGNFGSLSGLLPIPSQAEPLLSQLNDPIKAQTFFPAGPTTASYPAGNNSGVFEMTSKATATGVSARAAIADLSNGLFSLQGVEGSTTATASSSARSTANSSFAGLSILGGLISIGASTSTASATSNGNAVNGTATTHLGAISIAGDNVSIGTDGLVVGPAAATGLQSLLTPADTLVNDVISLLQLKFTPLPVSKLSQAPSEAVTSGGLQISLTLPSELNLSLNCSFLPASLSDLETLCTLPGLLQGASVTLTIARATATAEATPSFSGPGGPATPLGSVPATGIGITAGTSPSTSGAPVTSTDLPPTSPSIAPTSTPSISTPVSTSPTSTATIPASSVPISLSTPVKAALVILLLIVAGAIGAGLWRFGSRLEGTATACPQKGEQ